MTILVTAINPLNAELNPICHLLALLGAHHILHVSRVRAKFIFNVLCAHYLFVLLFSKYQLSRKLHRLA